MRIKQKLKVKGRYKFTLANIKTEYQRRLNDKIVRLREQGKEHLHLIRELNRTCETRVIEASNLVVTTGLTLLADNLTNSAPDNDPFLNYCALGTGTTAPALGDTTLETEVYRNTTASATNASGIAYVTMFVAAADDNDTYKEFGTFADASGAADSGVLFSRSAINITKSAVQSLTIDYQLTIAN